MKKLSPFIAIALLIASAFSNAENRILHIGNSAEPGTLDPHRYFANAEEHLLKDLFHGLSTMGPHGEIQPGTILSSATSEDGLVWTFHLDPEAQWSDGEPLTAQDYVFSFRRLQDPKTASPLAHFLYAIKNARAVNSGELESSELGVEARNPHTLIVRLEEPFPFLLERLLYPIAYPIPKHVVSKFGDDWIKAENWVSNGAYVLKEWRPQEYVAMVKNPRFQHTGQVQIDEVRYYPISEPATAYNRYLAGDMDIVHGYPHNLIATVLKERPQEVRNVLLQSIMYLVFNVEQPPFDDVLVRKALAKAIVKERLTENLLGAGEIPSNSIVPPIIRYSPTDIAEAIREESSSEQARSLLAEAGFDSNNPLHLTLRYISSEENKRVYVAIAAMWQQVGVETTLHHTNLATHFSDLQRGEFQVAQAGWFGENNAEHYIELLWSKIGPANYGRYASSVFDSTFEKARLEAEVQIRKELLAEAEHIALQDYPVIPLYVTMTLNLVKPYVGGWSANGRNLHPVRFMYWQ